MAGGGIKGGTVVGATDDLGIHAVTDRIHFRDLHTTILNQLGLTKTNSPISTLAVRNASPNCTGQ
jgi:hypothetical protein